MGGFVCCGWGYVLSCWLGLVGLDIFGCSVGLNGVVGLVGCLVFVLFG